MDNYLRAIKIALRFRWTVAGAVVSSLMIAVLWGGNIGALYPVLQVAFKSQSLQQWIEEEIEKSEASIQQTQQKISNLQAAKDSDTADIKRLTFDLEMEEKTLAARQRLKPYLNHPWVPKDPFRTVMVIVFALMIATIVKGFFVFHQSMFVSAIEQRVTFELRRQFFHQALRMDVGTFSEERTSGLLSRFNADIQYLTVGIKNLFGSGLREPLKITACLIGASLISWRLLVFSLILTPVIGFLIRKLAASIKRANRRILEEFTQLYGVLTETFNGIQTVQAYTLEQSERTKFYRVSKECFRKSMRIAFYSSLTKPITETMGIAMISLALLSGAYLTLNQETHLFGIRLCDRPLDTPSLLVFYGMLIGATEPARKLSDIFSSLQAGVAASDRLFPMLDQRPKILSPKEPVRLEGRHQRIQFENVFFHYHEDTPILKDLNLDIEFGETIAIVGPNGCGKSTFLHMLPRFFDPISGKICFDGIDLRELRLKDIRSRIGLVNQHAYLFDDTVYSNIAAGKSKPTEQEVIEAAKHARAHKFIEEKLAQGYDTIVGSSGSRLSGGQRQRIALARAMIRDPEILILDEATSQIDLESEQLIHQALEEFAKGRTVFMITHRLASLHLADRIMVMNGGRVEDIAPHEELIKRSELYQRLYQIHFRKSA